MIKDWPHFISKVLCKYQTKDLILDEYCPNIQTTEIIEAICEHSEDLAIRRLWIRSVRPKENTFAMELICGLNAALTLRQSLRIIWRVRIIITGEGIALVKLLYPSRKSVKRKFDSMDYCYEMLKLDYDENRAQEVQVELDTLRTLYNGNKNDIHNLEEDGEVAHWRPKVHVKAI